MNREQQILPILYEMALVIGSETSVKPLLMKTLQRLLYHTSFPAGLVFFDLPPDAGAQTVEVRIDAAVGDYELGACIGRTVKLPAALLRGGAELREDAALLESLPCSANPYSVFLRLPIDHCGVILLLAPAAPHTELPLTRIFQPVMANLAKAILLCRHNEAYTSGIIADRDRAWEALKREQKLFIAGPTVVFQWAAKENWPVEYVSPNVAQFGYSADDFISGRMLYAGIIHPEDLEWVIQEVKTYSESRAAHFTQTYRIIRADGEARWIEDSTIIVRNDAGEVTHYDGYVVDITQRKRAEEHIRYLAYHDELTGLPNRLLLLDRIRQEIIEAARHDRRLAIVCLDLKGFKNVNDTLGHETGDLFLKAVAERLAACLRPGDSLARFGGDDFCAMLADLARSEDVAHAMQTIRDGFTQPLHADGHELRLPVTLGISLYPADGADAETLLKNADIAMHRARERGDDYQYYSAEMTATAAGRLAMENDLRNALERGEFLLHYQPQTSLANGAITGVEALVRWQHPRLGLLPPAKFIPLAEETGLIVPLGEWVLRHACAQAQAWHEAGLPALCVAVNLSARQFRQPDLDKIIGRVLAETGLAPHSLELELTESILIQQPEAVADTLARLARHGVQISIDDFGTGYSSLAYLKHLPIDALKIDCGFVRDITTDPDDAAIVNAIITMAHALDIQTVAEGVETKEQQDFLRRQGCGTMQGYYFSRPVPAGDIARLLLSGRRPAAGESPGGVAT